MDWNEHYLKAIRHKRFSIPHPSGLFFEWLAISATIAIMNIHVEQAYAMPKARDHEGPGGGIGGSRDGGGNGAGGFPIDHPPCC